MEVEGPFFFLALSRKRIVLVFTSGLPGILTVPNGVIYPTAQQWREAVAFVGKELHRTTPQRASRNEERTEGRKSGRQVEGQKETLHSVLLGPVYQTGPRTTLAHVNQRDFGTFSSVVHVSTATTKG